VKAADVAAAALSHVAVTEEESFGPGTQVYKVAGKVFGILQPDAEPPQVTLKCDPDLALELRAQFESVIPGYHTNKRHWNTVLLDGTVPSAEIGDMITHAYDTVVAALPKKVRSELASRPH
jgi:predicted DNA-binding protein (MmcQ/YjbR family)